MSSSRNPASGKRSGKDKATGGRERSQDWTSSGPSSLPINMPQRPRSGSDSGLLVDSLKEMRLSQTITASDPTTRAETVWEISETTEYIDPADDSSRRGLNVKRIREVPSDSSTELGYYQRQPGGVRRSVEAEFRIGTVIAAVLVPPTQNQSSVVSRITPTGYYTAERSTLRLRRFVIIEERTENRNSFLALAIKTYNGQGVAAPGVIKSHHAIIHTTKSPPPVTEYERPKRLGNGQVENGMQPQSIRVTPLDRTTALDPLSRLDFCDRYLFDYGVPEISIFGHVHRDSQGALRAQSQNVWAAVQTAVVGPLAIPTGTLPMTGSFTSGSSTATPGSTTSTTRLATSYPSVSYPQVSGYSSAMPQYGGVAGPHTASSGLSWATPGPSITPGPSNIPRPPNTARIIPPSNQPLSSHGPISVDQLRTSLQNLRRYAEQNSLTVPNTNMALPQLQYLAGNGQARAAYMKTIKDRWDQERDEEEEEEEDDDDDDDGDDDDDDDDHDDDNDNDDG